MARYSVPLPNRITVYLLGFPAEDADDLARMAKELMESEFPLRNRTDRGEGFANAFPEFAGYIDAQIDAREDALRAGETRTDVVSRLVQLEIDGVRLSRTQARALTRNLITGGLTTTSQLLGNLLHALLTIDGLDAAMRADATLFDRAIEESLRVSPPILFVARGCVHETAVAGTPVGVGERVIVGMGSANRDEQVFADAEHFRADRPNSDQHLTFGYGAHVCPGATLAARGRPHRRGRLPRSFRTGRPRTRTRVSSSRTSPRSSKSGPNGFPSCRPEPHPRVRSGVQRGFRIAPYRSTRGGAMRVLVVEDERRLAAGLRTGLEAEGFAVDVALTASTGCGWPASTRTM